ncbi:MAG: hypothetical protein HY815_02560 [Candidatus Riflebacteria bacterium]|nr:hypothetical protein [Candidatus Riflebacteria bacterium]
MDADRVELFAPGCLGTCWYGKYHYLEPWVGCEHDCDYCYARYRSAVSTTLSELSAGFSDPCPLQEPDQLMASVSSRLAAGDVKILKLSRFTDLFMPRFVRNGLSDRLMRTLLDSPVERLIITTKGVPSESTLELMGANASRVSFSVVAKPGSAVCLERNAPSVNERLAAAARLHDRGVMTTVHMDPIVPGFEDGEEELAAFFRLLEEHRLGRVMFSLLLLCDAMVEDLRIRHGEELVARLLALYDRDTVREYLPHQRETTLFAARADVQKATIERISRLLKEMGFSFVLCSLKNVGPAVEVDHQLCPRCTGTFYA